jgi:hypothetical protein
MMVKWDGEAPELVATPAIVLTIISLISRPTEDFPSVTLDIASNSKKLLGQ